MQKFLFGAILLLSVLEAEAQNTVTSGNWSDPTVWSGGAVPAAGGTVNVNNPLTIDTNLSPTGVWTFNSNATDLPGGTAYTFNPNAGTNAITVNAGTVVTFEGGTAGTPNTFNSGTINIYGTLILGYTQLNNDANLNINVQPGGTLIIIGDLTNKNNSGTLVVGGTLQIYGNYDGQTGSTTLSGSGNFTATGSITSNGNSTVFGTKNDCVNGPCSGSTLACTFDNYITPSAQTMCSGNSGPTLVANQLGGGNLPASPTYAWEKSIDNVTWSSVGTNSNSYVTGTLTQTTYYHLKITSGACTSTSATTVITVLSTGGWIGTTSNWGTASNWCSNSVPTSSTDVTIINGTGVNSMPVINSGTAAAVRNLTISSTFPASSVTVANAANASLALYGNFTNNGTFTDNSTASAAGVILTGAATQTLSGTYPLTFNNLTINNSSGVTSAYNISVASNLTMTAGNLNMGGYVFNLGSSAASTGALTYTAGSIYNGNIQRWFPTTAVAIGGAASLFPIGTGTDYRPIYFGSTGLTTGGTVKARHTSIVGSTTVSYADGASTIQKQSNSYWTVTTGNGIASGGTPFSIRTEGTGFGTVGAVTDLRITKNGVAAPGADGAHAGTTANPQVNRTGISVANLPNSYYWGSINSIQTPLPVGLYSFKGNDVQGRVDLEWITETEVNNDHFTIYHSDDGETFSAIGSVKGKGTYAGQSNYRLTHPNPVQGANYYKLQQTDFNGVTTDLKVIKVLVDGVFPGVQVYPNPVRSGEYFHIAFSHLAPSQSTDVQIINVQGQLVHQFTALTDAAGNITYDLQPVLSPGLYIMKAGTFRTRIIVQ